MSFSREIQRVLAALLLCLAAVALAAAYWAVAGGAALLGRDDNPRRVEVESRIVRGNLYDRSGTPIAGTEISDSGVVTRTYPFPALNSAIGYSSLRYGTGGIESAYDPLLRGDDSQARLRNSLLHTPIRGSDLQLTLDAEVQQALATALAGQHGAGVVLSVPDGEVLALVSLPDIDPALLDAEWDALRADPANPFFNRALQGRYQPGGEMQSAVMIAALLAGQSLDSPSPDGAASVMLNGLELTCAANPPQNLLTLQDAYAFACPAPFDALAQSLGESRLQPVLAPLNALNAVELLPATTTSAPTIAPAITPGADYRALALGQSNLTFSPLAMALFTAAIVNDGNAPQPYLLSAVRAPGQDWADIHSARPPIPITTANTARRLQDLMRYAVTNGAAQDAARAGVDIGGHAALGLSGSSAHAWFTGFATLAGREAVAVAIVLEDSRDTGLAAEIGGAALLAAHQAISASAAVP